MPEEEQLALLRKDPASDLPVFIFKFVCDRGITHEVVRHRVFSFTQESTRYVNYKNKGMVLILPEEIQDSYDSLEERFIDQTRRSGSGSNEPRSFSIGTAMISIEG